MSDSRLSPSGPWARLRRRLDPARARFWGVIVPVHVIAFGVLYLGTYRLLERTYVEAGATAARVQLDQAVRDLPLLVEAARAGRNPHVFAHLVVAHRPLDLRLYRRDGKVLGAATGEPDAAEAARIREFVARDEPRSEVWLDESGGRQWVRGVVRLTAEGSCVSCHRAGSTLGAASMRIDFTDQLAEIEVRLGRRLALLLAAWLGVIGAVTLVVQRTVRRSGARLRADLAASVAGEPSDEIPAPGLPLDPVAAEVHRSLHEFLRRQRERESQVATRLAHVDQLASLGRLAAGLAHEIKNPLAGIQGALELLRDEIPQGETHRLYGEMLEELKRVHDILQRLLESARPAPLRLASAALDRLLAETAELLRPSLRRLKVELVTETAEGLPPLHLDSAKIRQVLVNLIQNAAEAMPPEGGRVAVRATAFEAEDAVVIAVEDNGPGIPAEDLPRLFEPFFTTKFAGTGLGLSISKSLIGQHGGRIEVSSETDRGSTFLIVLPVRANRREPEGGEPEER